MRVDAGSLTEFVNTHAPFAYAVVFEVLDSEMELRYVGMLFPGQRVAMSGATIKESQEISNFISIETCDLELKKRLKKYKIRPVFVKTLQ